MVNTVGTIIIEALIDGLSIKNIVGGMMRGLYHLQFVPLYLGSAGNINWGVTMD